MAHRNSQHVADARSGSLTDRGSAPPADDRRCANCGSDAAGNFCPECGQETHLRLPSVREILSDAAGRIVAWDGRTWRTLIVLLFRPGMLTTEYFRGRRRRYLRPARLFFVTALLLFAVMKLVNTPVKVMTLSLPDSALERAGKGDARSLAAAAASVEIRSGTLAAAEPARDEATASERGFGKGVKVHADPTFDDVAASVDRFLPASAREHFARFRQLSQAEQSAQIYSGALRYGPYALVALLPLFALLQKLSYLQRDPRHPRRPFRYTEHLVFGAHLHAFAFLMLVGLTLSQSHLVDAMLSVWILVYVGRARTRVYGGPWWAGFLRGLPVGLIYTLMLAITMTVVVGVAIAL